MDYLKPLPAAIALFLAAVGAVISAALHFNAPSAFCFLAIACCAAYLIVAEKRQKRELAEITRALANLAKSGATAGALHAQAHPELAEAVAQLSERITRDIESVRRSNSMRKELVGNI